MTYKIGAPGRHLVSNSLAVLATAVLVGADLALAALALAEFKPTFRARRVDRRSNFPAARRSSSTRATTPIRLRWPPRSILLGQTPIGPRGRRIAVLGDMLELGPRGRALHRGLLAGVETNAIDLVFCCGPLMRALWQALPAGRRGGYAENSAALEAQVMPAIRAGDVVMVKGSLGSRMAPIVKALQRHSARHNALGN